MRGLVYHGPGDVRCERVADPVLSAAHGALVRVTAASICGSDLHLLHGRVPVEPGFVVGHEFVGVVEEPGADVTRLRRGDRVLASGLVGCGVCPPCRAGEATTCTTHPLIRVFGVSRELHGGQAERVYVPFADFNLFAIPPQLHDEDVLFLTDILPTGYQGALYGAVAPGEVVAVVGGGPVGLCAAIGARLLGAERVIVSDPVPARRTAAIRLGVEAASPDEAPGRVLDATDGRGADVAIEAVGRADSLTAAVELARVGGRVSVLGVFVEPDLPFPMGLVFLKELTLRTGLANIPRHVPVLLPHVASGRLRPRDLVTHRLALSEGAEAYRLFDERRDGCLKVLLDPTR